MAMFMSTKQTPIAKALRAAAITQRELARVVEVDKMTVYAWCCGRISPKKAAFIIKFIEMLAANDRLSEKV